MNEVFDNLASAVVLPDAVEEISTPTGGTKRRKSSSPGAESKRSRLDTDAQSPRDNAVNGNPQTIEATASTASRHETVSSRRNISLPTIGADEDRKRGKRLFGALLGTLSQSSTSSSQKRREDIDRKQQARLKQLENDLEEERRKGTYKLTEKRVIEQEVWNEQSKRYRHESIRAIAYHLETKAEPKLYFNPYKLLPKQKEDIEAQVIAADSIIRESFGESEGRMQVARDGTFPTLQLDGANERQEAIVVASNNETATADVTDLADTDGLNLARMDKSMLPTVENGTAKDDNEDHEELIVDPGDDGEDALIY